MSAATATALTPTPRSVARRLVFWVGVLVIIAIVSLVTYSLTKPTDDADPLSATNAAPAGARAVVQVLGQQGVTVTATASLDDTLRRATDAATTTIFVYDSKDMLPKDRVAELSSAADRIVLVEPDSAALEELAPGIAQAGVVKSATAAKCALPAAERAGSITAAGSGYRILDDATGATGCFDSGDGVYSLVSVVDGSRVTTVLGASKALSNDAVLNRGNAALALGILGETSTLIWYTPSIADLADDTPPTFAELSPAWVIPTAVLIFIVALAAAFWRGRRFGPLVVENLPVVVRASETMEGRARLYEKGSARLRALDSLRIGTIGRLVAIRGLPRLATVDDVIESVAAGTGRDRAGVRALLVDTVPRSDADLVRLSDELLLLETETTTASRPGTDRT